MPSSIRSNGPRGALEVSWTGHPTFPVRMVYEPDVCAPGINCTAPEQTFATAVNPLVFEGAVWCAGVSSVVFFDYRVYLEDATGARTAPANADVTCYP